MKMTIQILEINQGILRQFSSNSLTREGVTWAKRKEGYEMGRESFTTTKGVSMMDSGRTIRWMVKEFFTILTVKLLMMDNGGETSSTGLERCSTKTSCQSKEATTTKTLITWTTTGHTTREI